MFRSEIAYSESQFVRPATQDTSQLAEKIERRARSELANAWLGALVVIFTAVIFYGGIAACICYFR